MIFLLLSPEDQQTVKQCCTCKIPQPRTAFYKNASKSDGLQARCKRCIKADDKQRSGSPKNRLRYKRFYWNRKAHPEQYQQYQRQRRATRLDHRQKHLSVYRLKHQEHYRAHPEQYAHRAQAYRARKAQALINDFTPQQWKIVKEIYGSKCVYCGQKMLHLTQDHLTPLSKGGNNTLSNIVPACRSCNSKKGTGASLIPVQPLLLI